jgi:ABC-type uncharacterized transport system permease subunit
MDVTNNGKTFMGNLPNIILTFLRGTIIKTAQLALILMRLQQKVLVHNSVSNLLLSYIKVKFYNWIKKNWRGEPNTFISSC